MSTRFTCDYSADAESLPHFREHCVGSGHGTLALHADWQVQWKQCREELGFRHYGVPKPIYRALQMVRALGDKHVKVTGRHDNVAVWIGRHDRDNPRTDIVLINQALPEHPVRNEPVRLRLMHPATMVTQGITRSRVDEDHANPERAWREMGSPEYPSNAQVTALLVASEATPRPMPFVASDDMVEVDLVLAPQSVNHL